MIRGLLAIICGIGLSACSVTLPLEGNFETKSDKFLGEATGYMSGKGTLKAQSQSGVKCTGTFQYAESRVSGDGTFQCDDGRVGTFLFTSSGYNGNGIGKFTNGEAFSFKFGSPAYIGARDVQVHSRP